jgi:hypothetical protein
MVSEYARAICAMKDQVIIPTNGKKKGKKSLPVIFAVLYKMVKEGNLKGASEFLIGVIK